MIELGQTAIIATFLIIISMFVIAGICRIITKNKPSNQTEQLIDYFKQ